MLTRKEIPTDNTPEPGLGQIGPSCINIKTSHDFRMAVAANGARKKYGGRNNIT